MCAVLAAPAGPLAARSGGAGAAFWAISAHMIDLARWYVGDIASVAAHLTTFVGRVTRPRPDSRMTLRRLRWVS
jgi:predicted dehydrogenase